MSKNPDYIRAMPIDKLMFHIMHNIAVAGMHLEEDASASFALCYVNIAQNYLDELKDKLTELSKGEKRNG